MKKLLALASVLIWAAVAQAAPPIDTITTNWIPGYTYVGLTNGIGDRGLATNETYACFPLSQLQAAQPLTATQAASTSNGDVRPLMYSLVKTLAAHYNSTIQTNRPARQTYAMTYISPSATNVGVVLVIQTTFSESGGVLSIPSE